MANLLLRCADNRVNEVSAKKFSGDLHLAELGGVKWHIARDSMEELFEQVEFVVEHKGATEFAIMAHTDCAFYKELGETDPEIALSDLHDAADQLTERFPDLKILLYRYDVETKNLELLSEND